MKKIYFFSKAIIVLLLSFLMSITGNAQTILAPGDIAVIGYNTTGSPDNLAILILKDLTAGTVFYINDNEVTPAGGTSFTDLNEGEASFTVKTGQTISAGTVIVLPWGAAAVSTSTYDYSVTTGAGLGNNNEEIYIYTAPTITSTTPTSFIYFCKIGTSASSIPSGLSLGSTSIAPSGAALRYATTGATYTGTANALLTAIGNTAANWNSTGAATLAATDWTFTVSIPLNPTVSLSVSSTTGNEAGTTAITVTATASAAVTGAQTVDLAVTGTGITAGDYSLTGTAITIANGATTGSVTFTVVDDALVEGTETATLTISNPSAGIVLGSPLTQNIVITDNDLSTTTVSLSVSANTASEENQTLVTVTATTSAPVSGNQTVLLAVTGIGITTFDFLLSSTTFTILNGETTGSVTFKVRNDAETEGTETATLTISNPSFGIVLGTPVTQNISITDNSCQPIIRTSTATSVNGAEISVFDPGTNRVFTVAGTFIEYYNLSNTGVLSAASTIPVGFTSAGNNIIPNSVGVKNGIVAVSYAIVNAATNAQQPGVVAFYNAASAAYISQITVGYLPDMLIFSPDGNKIYTANEGEPNSYGQGNSFDPEGSVSIIDITAGAATATVVEAGFTSFNGQMASLKAAGVRIFGPGATVAQDLEPEYIAFSADGTKAFVVLQENNAVAELNLATNTFTQIIPLGLKNHSLAGNGMDASDRDSTSALGKINIQNWPVYGMYQPDAVASFSVAGNTYYITANEGDARDYTGYSEEIRVGLAGYLMDPTVFPNAATLKLNANLGRLNTTNATGDINGDGDFDEIHAFGARSFTIWNSSFSQVYDSGDQLEQLTAAQNPGRFNADNSSNTNATFDSRSDNKGPEPEAVTTGVVNGILYAFVGIERSGDIFVYDISIPTAPVFKQYIDNVLDFGVEGIVFVPANESPTGKALIISSAEVSKTVSVYEFSLVPNALAAVNTNTTAMQGSVTAFGDCAGLVAQTAQNGAVPITGNVTAKVYIQPTVPSQNSVPYVQRHYEITPAANATTATGRVTLYFTQAEFDNFNADPNSTLDLPTGTTDAAGKTNLLVVKYPGVSSDGSGLPSTYPGPATIINPNDADIIFNTAATRWEVSFDVAGFSGFFVQTNATVLPLTLLSFIGKADRNNSELVWKITNEINHASYEVQYSKDGRRFATAGVRNATTVTGEKTYNYTHENAANIADKLYYRLKMISTSSVVTYSNIIIVRFGATNKLITDLYPTPTTGIINIVSNASTVKPITIRIFDLSGRKLTTALFTASGSNTIDITRYAKGIYLLEASVSDGTKQQFKIVKQ